jgi:hypothetical protein
MDGSDEEQPMAEIARAAATTIRNIIVNNPLAHASSGARALLQDNVL